MLGLVHAVHCVVVSVFVHEAELVDVARGESHFLDKDAADVFLLRGWRLSLDRSIRPDL